ncbi:MAG: PilZ domain-containing protein, partial [Candidatus Hydrogenedentes bacterium]|nr:PilZ domain-containing protein [Candidatus Hydrogenedentota bacterium]
PMSKGKESDELFKENKSVIKSAKISEEKREFTRCKVCLSAEIMLSTGVVIEGKTENISMNGLLFKTERGLPIGTEVKIHLLLRNSEEKTDYLNLGGKVVRIDEKGVAIKFDEMDFEVVEHLKRLLTYNIDTGKDEGDLDKEFDAHIGIRRRISWFEWGV